MRLIGHGSSDAAAAFAVYAFGLLPGWTAVRDSISLFVYYEAQLDFSDSVVIALSQSGQTPDVVAYVERARAQGARTIALTNEPDSELARLCAGQLEQSLDEIGEALALRVDHIQLGDPVGVGLAALEGVRIALDHRDRRAQLV